MGSETQCIASTASRMPPRFIRMPTTSAGSIFGIDYLPDSRNLGQLVSDFRQIKLAFVVVVLVDLDHVLNGPGRRATVDALDTDLVGVLVRVGDVLEHPRLRDADLLQV